MEDLEAVTPLLGGVEVDPSSYARRFRVERLEQGDSAACPFAVVILLKKDVLSLYSR